MTAVLTPPATRLGSEADGSPGQSVAGRILVLIPFAAVPIAWEWELA